MQMLLLQILAEFRLQRADSDELEESPMSHHDSPLLSNRASFLEHIHSLPSDPFAPKLSKFPLGGHKRNAYGFWCTDCASIVHIHSLLTGRIAARLGKLP